MVARKQSLNAEGVLNSRRALLTAGTAGIAGALMPGARAATAKECSCTLAGVFSIRDFGASGDGRTDDTAAFQAAIAAARAAPNGVVYVPPAKASAAYVITKSLRITGPIKIIGAGPTTSTIWAQGFRAGQFIFDFDCVAKDVVQHIEISGLTVRSDNRLATGIRLQDVSYVLLKNVVAYDLYDGVLLSGPGTYSISFEQFTAYQIARYGVLFASGAAAHYSFVSSTFAGDVGVYIDNASGLNNVSFVNCNFEQCTTNSFYAGGDVLGLSFSGCRTEGCNGDDFRIQPIRDKMVAGLVVSGCFFTSDNGESVPIRLGGAGGRVRGFNIAGNYVGYAGDCFVHVHGDDESGFIAGNYFSGKAMAALNVAWDGIHLFGNANARGLAAAAGKRKSMKRGAPGTATDS